MAATSADLPEDCWELIFKRLVHHSHFEAPSISCKRFLSITDDLRTHLRVLNPAIRNPGILSELLHRFTHLKSIDLNEIPITYARTGRQMNGLRVLNCSDVNHFDDDDCIAIAKAMPWLEELDISSVSDSDSIDVSDVGVEALSLDLKGLRKDNLSGNLYLTGDGFRFVLQNSPSLNTFAVEKVSFKLIAGSSLVMIQLIAMALVNWVNPSLLLLEE